MRPSTWNRLRWWLLPIAVFIVPSIGGTTPTQPEGKTTGELRGGAGHYTYTPLSCGGPQYAVGVDTFHMGGTVMHKTGDGVTLTGGGQYQRETVSDTTLIDDGCEPGATCTTGGSPPRRVGEVEQSGRVAVKLGYDFSWIGADLGPMVLILDDEPTVLPTGQLWVGTDWLYLRAEALPLQSALPDAFLDLGFDAGTERFRFGAGLVGAARTGGPWLSARVRATERAWIGVTGVLSADDAEGTGGFGQIVLRIEP